MDNSIKNSSKMKRGLRRLAVATVAAVAGLGLAGVGTAAAEAPTANGDPVVESEAANDVAWVFEAGGYVLFNEDTAGLVTGGYILSDGAGVIEVDGGEDILITYSDVNIFGGLMFVEYGTHGTLMAELEAINAEGSYAFGAENTAGTVELEIPVIKMTAAS